jgi:endonuclease-3 related protein
VTDHHADATSIQEIYATLDATYRDDVWHWMPDVAPDPMQIMAGAVLVQHTTWTNAERALGALRGAGLLDPHPILSTPVSEIEALVRVSGTPSVKTRRLRALCEAIVRAGGVDAFLAQPAGALRGALLSTHGIGPETADAIALYAGGKRLFVIDAYTRRIFGRLGVGPDADGYDAWQGWFEQGSKSREQKAESRGQQQTANSKQQSGEGREQRAESRDAERIVEVYRRYHGYILLHAKALCRATPRCGACPLLARCPEGRARTQHEAPVAAIGAAL